MDVEEQHVGGGEDVREEDCVGGLEPLKPVRLLVASVASEEFAVVIGGVVVAESAEGRQVQLSVTVRTGLDMSAG